MLGDILDNSGNYLRIFMPGNFEVDMTLPKFKKELDKDVKQIRFGGVDGESDNNIDIDGEGDLLFTRNMVGNSRFAASSENSWVDSDGRIGVGYKKPLSPFSRIREYFMSKKEKKENEKLFDVIRFFKEVKLSSKEAQKDYVDSVNEFKSLLQSAKDMGQLALVDEIMHKIDYYKIETILHAEGHLYKISEEKLVDLVKKTEKGLRLDYIKNFVRVIPKEVIEAKRKADALNVFDNYVVLHYDPKKVASKQTKKEKEQERKKKADPILFGVIEHSHDLYYITDWVDEKCDLTLDELVKLMKVDKKSLEIKKPSDLIK